MKDKIKFIWDFHGEEAEGTAKHHCIHLKEFIDNNNFDANSATEKINHKHFIAYIIAPSDKLVVIRDALRPHRAQKI